MRRASKAVTGFRGFAILLLGIAGGGLIALSPDIALPFALLLLPGILALVLDRSPGCGVARAMLLFQAAASVHPALDAWYRCAGIDGCMTFLMDGPMVLRVWLAAGAGWLLAQTMPLAVKVLEDYRLSQHRAQLQAKRQALVEEWGLDGQAQR